MSLLQAVHKEKKNQFHISPSLGSSINQLYIYMKHLVHYMMHLVTHMCACIYSLVDELLGRMNITRVIVKRNMAFLYYIALICILMHLPTFSKSFLYKVL